MKNKIYKRLLAGSLSALLCLNSFSAAVFAEEAAIAQEASITDEIANPAGESISEEEAGSDEVIVQNVASEAETTDATTVETTEEITEVTMEETTEESKAATTIGLGVQKHTQEEIQAFFDAHPALTYDKVDYERDVHIGDPYYEGQLTETSQQVALNMLNQMRYIAGLDADVELDSTYEQLCQAGSFLNRLNGVMSHYPSRPASLSDPQYDTLYSMGYQGCSHSNLASGNEESLTSDIVYGWMHDGDSDNIDRVGHRRWILNPSMKYTGFGCNKSFTSMYALDCSGSVNANYIAWPAQEMPWNYFSTSFPWSLSIRSSVNMATTSVKLTRKSDGKVWNFSSGSSDGYFNVSNGGYGLTGCIIFRPSNLDSISLNDSFDVEVSLNNGETLIAYTVNFFYLYTSSAPKYISSCDFQMSPNVKGYGGTSTTPEITVAYRNTTLKAGVDYSVSYKKNASGLITEAVVTGMGSYTGTKRVKFTHILYELNGGSEEAANPVAFISVDDTSPDLKDPVRSGYVFLGWYDNPEFTGSRKYSVYGYGKESVTVYASWAEETPFTIHYDYNGGTSGPSDDHGDARPTVSYYPATWFGHNFLGWSTSPDATEPEYLINDPLPPKSEWVLYAVWEEAPLVSNERPDVYDLSTQFSDLTKTYKIVPDEDRTYTFESSGAFDPFAELYDSQQNRLASDDDSGQETNFKLSVDLKKGQTYYLRVFFYNNSPSPDVTLSVTWPYTPFEITKQPTSITAGAGASVSYSIEAVGENLSYQWQYSKNGGKKWLNSSASAGGQTNTLSFKVSTSNAANIYRCMVVGNSGKQLISDTVGIELIPGVVIIKNPQSAVAAIGEYAVFTIDAENAAGYQWQYSKDGAHWYNSGAEGNQTDTLTVKGAQNSQGNRYRCVVLGIDGNKKKSLGCAMIVLKTAPKASSAAVGQTASFSLKAEGIASYLWQYSKDGGTTWYKSGAAGAETDTISFTVKAANRSMIYRCKLTTEDGAYAFTKPVGFN